MKNREVCEVGTRVKFVHDRVGKFVGTVVARRGERMQVKWDGFEAADGHAVCWFEVFEVRAA